MHNPHQTNNPPQLTNALNIPFRHGRFWLVGAAWVIVGICCSLLFLCLCLALLGYFSYYLGDSVVGWTVAIVLMVVFFAASAPLTILSFYYRMKTLDMKPAFVISDEGIIDNSNIAGFGFIPWPEVIDVKIAPPSRVQLAVVNAQYYIDRERAFAKKLLLKKKRPEPNSIIISTRYAKIKLVDFNQLIEERRKKIKRQ